MKRFCLEIIVAFCLLLTSATSLFACACCADRGTYSIWTSTVADYQNELLKDMKFGKKAEFYQTPADFDETHGLGELIQEWQTGVYADPDLVDAYVNDVWRFDFRSAGGKTGSLVLPRPLRMTSRRIDIPDNTSKAPDITLYKEFIFTGTVRTGTGFFKSGIVRPTTYTLLFQGRGNNCDNADDFTNWHLEVKGRRANYAFFGKMAVAGKEALDTPQ